MKNYNTKKKITIALLSVTAVCLIGGLIYYMDSMGAKPPVDNEAPIVSAEPSITVPEIDVPEEPTLPVDDNTETTGATLGTDETDADTVDSTDDTATTEPTQPPVEEKPSEDKPKTPDEATPPTENTPPVVDDSGEEVPTVVEPNKPADNSPKDGDVNANGDIYIEGFGWVQSSGEENQTIPAPNAGTGDLIGY